MQFYKQLLELSVLVTASALVLALIGYVVLTPETVCVCVCVCLCEWIT
jgi:hypothetical protein